MTEHEQEQAQAEYRRWLDSPMDECNETAPGYARNALIIAACGLGAFLGTWGMLALITWVAS